MSIYQIVGKISRALSIRNSAGVDGVLQGSAVLGCHVVNGVSGSFYACLRQSSSICTRQYSRTSKVANSAGRGFASGRDDEGLQASKESRSQEVLEGENTGTDNKRLLECKDPVTFARSSDDEAPKSSGQQESDIEQDAAGQQDPGQSLCKNHTTENEPGKQQRKQDDSSASGMESAGWAQSEMAQRFKEDLQRLSGQNKIERHVREDPTWFPILLWDGLVAGPIWAFWHSRLMRYCTRNFEKSEFLEGSLDAFHIVLQLWSEQEWKLMESMTSQRLLKVFREMSEEYAANKLTLRMEPEGEISASLKEVKFLSPAGLLRYAENAEEAKEPKPDAQAPETDETGLQGFQSLVQKTADGAYDTSSQWHLVLTVAFHGSVKLTEVNAGGQVVREMIDKKPQKWRFCSSDTVAVQEYKAWQGVPLLLFDKLDVTDPDQWSLLEVV